MPNLTDRCDGYCTGIHNVRRHHGRCGFAPAPRHVSPRCAGRPRSAHAAPAARTGFPHLRVLRVLSAGDHPRIGPNSSRSPASQIHCGALIAHGRKLRIDPVSRFQPTKNLRCCRGSVAARAARLRESALGRIFSPLASLSALGLVAPRFVLRNQFVGAVRGKPGGRVVTASRCAVLLAMRIHSAAVRFRAGAKNRRRW